MMSLPFTLSKRFFILALLTFLLVGVLVTGGMVSQAAGGNAATPSSAARRISRRTGKRAFPAAKEPAQRSVFMRPFCQPFPALASPTRRERLARAAAGADRFGVAELNEALDLLPAGRPVQIIG